MKDTFPKRENFKNLFHAAHTYFIPASANIDEPSIFSTHSDTFKGPADTAKKYINLKYKKLNSFFRILLGSY